MNQFFSSWSRVALSALALPLAPAALALEATHQYFRFSPTALRETPGGANSIQLAEFEFKLLGTPLDLFGVTVSNPGGDNPASGAENPPNVIDGNLATKWLDFNKGGLVFMFPAAVTIDEYNFATANDAVARDPISWAFEGSDDGVTWSVLDVVENHPTTQVRQVYEVGFLLPDLPDPAITEFRITPAIVLDSEMSTLSWTTANGSAEISPAIGPVPDSGSQLFAPLDDADTTYTLTVTNAQGATSADALVRSVVGGSASFRVYRFTPVKLRGDGGENSIQLAEFEFLNLGLSVDRSGVTVTNPGGSNPGAELPPNLVDGSTATKWLDFNKGAVLFDFGVPTAIDAYRFTTANDSDPRDPVRWLLEGSDDGTTWTLLDNVTAFDYPTPKPRFTASQDFPLPGSSLKPFINFDSFFADQTTAIAGEEIVLYWQVSGNYDLVTLDDGTGPVTVGGFGQEFVTPPATTTYTLAASEGGGTPVTTQITVTIVTPANTDICYENFDSAGDELELLGSATIVNDFPNITLPGDASRLRLTPDLGDQAGTVWFRRRFDFSEGFDTTFDFQMISDGVTTGADGFSFIIHNTLTGTATEPNGFNENGLPVDALNVKFDSYINAGDLSAATIQVLDGTVLIAEVDLTAVPGITLGGTDPLDLTQDDVNAAPYEVRITYVPGDLDVYFDGVQVITDADVDLDFSFAVDSNSKGFVGFSGRTGGERQTHDITSWCLTEGAPVVVEKIDLLDVSYDGAGMLSLTWSSDNSKTYRIRSSTDGQDFSTVAQGGIVGQPTQTSFSVPVAPVLVSTLLFLVEEE